MKSYYQIALAEATDEATKKAIATQKRLGISFPFLVTMKTEMARARLITELMRPLAIGPNYAVDGGVWMDYLENRTLSVKHILNY